MDTPTRAYALRVSDDNRAGSDYLRLRAEIVEIVDGSEGPEPRNLFPDWYSAGDPFAGIAATGQASRRDPDMPASYAWRFGFMSADDPAPAEQVRAALRTIDRAAGRMRKATETYGSPATWGAYVARIAVALRVPIILGRPGPTGTYSEGAWTLYATPSEAIGAIDDRITRFARTGSPEYAR